MGHRNPLWAAWHDAIARGRDPAARDDLLTRYSFAIPNEAALEALRDASPNGVVEIGAGTGYWARLLHERGVDVVAFDSAPAPSAANTWFSGIDPWFDVSVGDESAVDAHGDRTLLLVWPTRNEDWAAAAIRRYASAGGTTIAYVGETIGGRTGDDQLHALTGEIDRCWSCAYQIATAACVCGITPLFRSVGTVEIPRWNGFEDDLRFYRCDSTRRPLAPMPTRDDRPGRLRVVRRRR